MAESKSTNVMRGQAERNRANSLSGQVAIEAMIYIGVFLFLTVFFAIFLIGQQAQELRTRQYALSNQVAGQISDAIALASSAGPGFNATFRMPPDIMGRMYVVNLSSTGSVFITLLSPPDMFGGRNLTFYNAIGGRGNLRANPLNPGAGERTYVSQGGLSLRAVWFNSSQGRFQVWVANTQDIFIG